MFGERAGKKFEKYVDSYVVFDLETTGVNISTDMVIEIGAVKVVKGKVVDTFHQVVNPMMEIPERIVELTGITNEEVLTGIVIEDALLKFNDFIEEYPLVGHNINRFDMKIIYRLMTERLQKTVVNDYMDTLPLSRHLLPNLEHHTLAFLCEHYKIDTTSHHRALSDAIMNQKLYECLGKEPPSGKETRFCPLCGDILRKRSGKKGLFYSCSTYPECKYIEDIN